MASEKSEQVAAQCEVVVHMAQAIAELHGMKAELIRRGCAGEKALVDLDGQRTHRLMETLGDILNGMDAVTDDDHWVDPVFEDARRLFPLPHTTERNR